MVIQCIFANVHVRFQNFFSGDSILRTGGGGVLIWIILFGRKGVSRPNVMLIVNLIRPNPPARSAHVYIASTNASGFILW